CRVTVADGVPSRGRISGAAPAGADTTSQVYVRLPGPRSSAAPTLRVAAPGASQDADTGAVITGARLAGTSGPSVYVHDSIACRANSSPVPAVNPAYAVPEPTAAGTSTAKACVQVGAPV